VIQFGQFILNIQGEFKKLQAPTNSYHCLVNG
jgi:hypothetical protein